MLIIEKDLCFGVGLKTAEAYFVSPEDVLKWGGRKYDIVSLLQGQMSETAPFFKQSLVRTVDLSQANGEIFNKFSKIAQDKIKKAQEDRGISCYVLSRPTLEEIIYFCARHQSAQQAMGVVEAQRKSDSFCLQALCEMAKHGAEVITFARIGQDPPLCLHSYTFDGEQVRLKLSVSSPEEHSTEFAETVDIADHLLTWEDIVYFKTAKARIYSFGSGDGTAFGGTPVPEYNYYHAFSSLGSAVLNAAVFSDDDHKGEGGQERIDLGFASLEDLGLSEKTSHWHSNSGGADLDVVLEQLPITTHDTVIDVGCGKGGALITLSQYPFSIVDGVEISEDLLTVAAKNLEITKCHKTELIHADATFFDAYDKYNYIYMYSPFPQSVMEVVMEHINRSVARKPRLVTIIYRNPAYHDVLVGAGIFRSTQEFNHTSHPIRIYQNQF